MEVANFQLPHENPRSTYEGPGLEMKVITDDVPSERKLSEA